ncbi:MAG TPA: hypothetical protein PJ983_01790, partial [Flavobacteriales bacterium]|nr:hypothetical protein [Flavobacteriales bacterium]
STGDTRLTTDVRWCADSIVLPPLRGQGGHSLSVAAGARLSIDRSRTATRMEQQAADGSFPWFAPPTRFTIAPGADLLVEKGASLRLERGSALHVLPGARLEVEKGARLDVDSSSAIILHGDGRLVVGNRALKKLRKKKRLLSVQ